jgi:hypothetical protein
MCKTLLDDMARRAYVVNIGKRENTHMTHAEAVLNIAALIGAISIAGLVYVTFDAAREAFKNR